MIANPYADTDMANFYASLGYEGTYYLFARDLPGVLERHLGSGTCLDFACGAGRATRFLKSLGFDATGADISRPMLAAARTSDPGGTYVEVGYRDLSAMAGRKFDLIHSAFPYASVATLDGVVDTMRQLAGLLNDGGLYVCAEATPDIYTHEWTSFTNAGFEDNRLAGSGDKVTIAFRSKLDDPVTDILWLESDIRSAFDAAGFAVIDEHRPLGRADDGIDWVSETHVAPIVFYVLRQARAPRRFPGAGDSAATA